MVFNGFYLLDEYHTNIILTAFFSTFIVSAISNIDYTGSRVIKLTDDNFKNIVINSDKVWLVEFYGPWCSHCMAAATIYKEVAKKLHSLHRDKVAVGAVNVGEAKKLVKALKLTSVPEFLIFGSDKYHPVPFKKVLTARGLIDTVRTMI